MRIFFYIQKLKRETTQFLDDSHLLHLSHFTSSLESEKFPEFGKRKRKKTTVF